MSGVTPPTWFTDHFAKKARLEPRMNPRSPDQEAMIGRLDSFGGRVSCTGFGISAGTDRSHSRICARCSMILEPFGLEVRTGWPAQRRRIVEAPV